MPLISSVAFASRFTAKLCSGLAAARPASPSGVGDAYYATDTHVLSLADTAGTAWETFDLDGVSETVPVSRGGTGATTLAANSVLLGNGTSAVQTVAPSTSGNVLTSNGTTWVSSAPGAVSSVTKKSVRAKRSTGVAINTSDNSWENVPFDAEDYDTDSFHDNSTNNHRLTVPSLLDGDYHIWASLRVGELSGAQNGPVYLALEINGTEIAADSIYYSNSDNLDENWLNVSAHANLAAGDYAGLRMRKETGNGSSAMHIFDGKFGMYRTGV